MLNPTSILSILYGICYCVLASAYQFITLSMIKYIYANVYNDTTIIVVLSCASFMVMLRVIPVILRPLDTIIKNMN